MLFDDQKRAIGVEYLKGERLYQAHATPSDAPGEARQVRARREVILAGGVFNTPQLLMLSGIGPEAELRRAHDSARPLLERVGKNLQDRYEVAVVNRMEQPWDMLRGATFTTRDPQYRRWKRAATGIYTTNGVPLVRDRALDAPGSRPRSLLLRAARRLPRLQARLLGGRRGSIRTT